jgi:myo-inositol-1(or 4)-monophosphatase
MESTENLRRVLMAALRSSGQILRRHFGKAKISYKGKANLVTQVDRASERHILRIITRRFPNHAIMAEESGNRPSRSEYLWIIDPLDGTTNYAHGYPAACVNIGLLKRGIPLLGGTYDPFRDELFFAQRGRGAFLNGKRLHVSHTNKLNKSLLVTGFPYDRSRRSRFYVEFYRTFMTISHDVRRSGSAALDMAWIAAGRADAFWEFRLNPWDVAAGLLLVEEAGGKVTDFRGREWTDPIKFGRETLATNGKIQDAMLGILGSPRFWKGKDAHSRFDPTDTRLR